MEYSERQKEIFQQFYERCEEKGFDPTKGEAHRQRAVILAESNTALKKIFGKTPDGADVVIAYQAGAEYLRQKETAENAAKEFEKFEKLREKDIAFAERERQISELHGRDKRAFFVKQTISQLSGWYSSLYNRAMATAELAVALTKAQSQSESSWGTLGGIAAGITGSTAVGATVAAETMAKNEKIREENQKIADKNCKAVSPTLDSISDEQSGVNDMKHSAESLLEKVKYHLVSEQSVEELMKQIEIGQPQYSFLQDGVMIIKVDVCAKNNFYVANNVSAVLDGSFLAEIFDGETLVDRAFLNLPRDGITKDTPRVLYGRAMSAPPSEEYTVTIVPIALWLIEKYTFEELRTRIGYRDNRRALSQEICDVMTFCGHKNFEEVDLAWNLLKRGKTWEQRLEEKRLEADKKRIAEENAKKEAAKTRKKILKITGVSIVALIAVIIVGKVVSKVTENMKAYNDAVSIMEAGKYEEAITAFKALGNYKDCKEKIYNSAIELAISGKYEEAKNTFLELGNYNDCSDRVKSMELELKLDTIIRKLDEVKKSGKPNYHSMDEIRCDLEQLINSPDAEKLMEKDRYEKAELLLNDFHYFLIEEEERNIYNSSVKRWSYFYNAKGQIIDDGERYTYNSDDTIASHGLLAYTYDENGRLLKRTGREHGHPAEYTYTYNDLGQLINERNDYVTNNERTIEDTVYEYDENGLLIKSYDNFQNFDENGRLERTSKERNTQYYFYDDEGRLEKQSDNSTGTDDHYSYSCSYDKEGNLVASDFGGYHRKFSYAWIYAPDMEDKKQQLTIRFGSVYFDMSVQ